MIRDIIGIILLLGVTAGASSLSELKQVQDNQQLARFIHRMVTEDINPEEFLNGIRSSDKLNIATYKTEIPTREVYGTIVAERFQVELGKDFYERGKKYDVRATCSLTDEKNEKWRFNIIVFDQRQYNLMEELLKKQIDRAKSGK